MIEMLFASAFVAASCLQMAVVKRTNPNFLPCRRDHQRINPRERVWIANNPAFGRAVTEPLAAPFPADARLLVSNVPQPDDLR